MVHLLEPPLLATDCLAAVIVLLRPLPRSFILQPSTGKTSCYDVCLTGVCACLDLLSNRLCAIRYGPAIPYMCKLRCNLNQQYVVSCFTCLWWAHELLATLACLSGHQFTLFCTIPGCTVSTNKFDPDTVLPGSTDSVILLYYANYLDSDTICKASNGRSKGLQQ